MQAFEDLCPAPPAWEVCWPEIRAAFTWVRELEGVEQDPVHHAEGDAEIHARLACEALAALPQWRARPAAERVRLFAAVLLHDVAKPYGTQRVDGRITAHGHSRNDDLIILAKADILGRVCGDLAEVLENIALYEEYCAEQRCLDRPRAFPSDHARFWYVRTPGRDPAYPAHDDTRLTATILSGQPGAGRTPGSPSTAPTFLW